MARFIGNVAVVTGASSGIGEAICKEFVKLGFTVVGLARREEKLQALQNLLNAQKEIHRGTFSFIKCDLTKEEEIREAFAQIKSTTGRIQVLVNNAALLLKTSLSAVTGEHYDKIFDTNVRALLLCSKEAIQSMNDKDDNCVSGHIVNINSVAGYKMNDASVQYESLVYMASKQAAKSLSDAFRRELLLTKKRIKVTTLYPGVVKTDMTADLMKRRQLDGEYDHLSVEDVVAAVIYVLETPARVLISDMTIKALFEFY